MGVRPAAEPAQYQTHRETDRQRNRGHGAVRSPARWLVSRYLIAVSRLAQGLAQGVRGGVQPVRGRVMIGLGKAGDVLV